MIGKLERVPLREVWVHEAYDFTQWLEQNIDVVNDALGLEIISVDREQAAGKFSIDLVGEDQFGRKLIIENQLEKSDHDHLGKLITYVTAMQAQAAIWIVKEPRPEHVAAIGYLNQALDTDFYMVKVEAVRIGDSPPAPLLTLISGPSQEAKDVGMVRKEFAERYAVRNRWWTELIERSKPLTKLHAHITPGDYSWIGVSSCFRGLNFNYSVQQGSRNAELWIDRGKDSEQENKALFDQLASNQAEVDAAFGGLLIWDRMEGRRACVIRCKLNDGGYKSPDDQWNTLQDSQIDAMIRLERALKPYINRLKGEK